MPTDSLIRLVNKEDVGAFWKNLITPCVIEINS